MMTEISKPMVVILITGWEYASLQDQYQTTLTTNISTVHFDTTKKRNNSLLNLIPMALYIYLLSNKNQKNCTPLLVEGGMNGI